MREDGPPRPSEETISLASGASGSVEPLAFDVADSRAVEAAADAVVERSGSIDVLINSAGVALMRPSLEVTDDEWAEVINVNLTGVFYCCRAFGRHMVAAKKGRIINIASDIGIRGLAQWTAYSASKGGLISLTKSLAWEWAPDVTVNVLAPGAFFTDMNARIERAPRTHGSRRRVRCAQEVGYPTRDRPRDRADGERCDGLHDRVCRLDRRRNAAVGAGDSDASATTGMDQQPNCAREAVSAVVRTPPYRLSGCPSDGRPSCDRDRGCATVRRREIVKVALGKESADTAIVGGRVVNVHTLEILDADVAIKGDRIAAVGDIDHTIGDNTRVIEADGAYVTPGLVDGHLHMYHSYLGITEFVEAMLRHGVTSTADGFYGQGIVGGPDAVRFFKDSFERMPIRLIFLVPTLAYLQNRELGLTPAPGLSKDDMFEMLAWRDCRGLEEPPYLPISWEWEEFLDLFEATLDAGKVISGHASGITAPELQAYVGMGAATDHETVESLDGLMKVRAGMKLFMREGSGCTNVAELARLRTEHGVDVSTLGFCADVASPEKLWRDGGVDQNIRVAIAQGIDPAEAVRMASLSVAQTFRLDHDLGSVTAGRYADLLLVDDLPSFRIRTVIFGGQIGGRRRRLHRRAAGAGLPGVVLRHGAAVDASDRGRSTGASATGE